MELPLKKKREGGVLRESPFLTFTPEGRETRACFYTYGSGRWRLLGHREKGITDNRRTEAMMQRFLGFR